MKITIPYGVKKIELDIPDGFNVEFAYPGGKTSEGKDKIIRRSLDNPSGSESFDNWLTKNKNFLFIVNDASRPTPTFEILKELDKRLILAEAKYLMATGAHKRPDEEDLSLIFGAFYDKIKSNIIIHNAKDYEDLANLGTTKRGTEVWINKKVLEAGAIIPIGSVEPHYFAGFTGGRKSFIPGLAGLVTIEQNHKLALEEGVAAAKLVGNPVHTDLLDAFDKIPEKPIFSIQAVVNSEKELFALFSGNVHKSFSEAAEYAKNIFCVTIKEKADIVITVAKPPLDKNLYQAHKAIEHGKLALKYGGILILVASCKEGIGPDNFYKLLLSSADPDKIIKKAEGDYKLGYHKAVRIAELSKKAEVWLISETEDKILPGKFIKTYSSLQEAIKKSISKKGSDARILILMDGGNTVPLNRKQIFDPEK
jgi:nickel-dependent lactate racemase